jgi:hypothetical protein
MLALPCTLGKSAEFSCFATAWAVRDQIPLQRIELRIIVQAPPLLARQLIGGLGGNPGAELLVCVRHRNRRGLHARGE